MERELKHAHLRLTNDPRLVAGMTAAVDHFGEQAGLPHSERNEFGRACSHACERAFGSMAEPAKPLDVEIEEFSDRVEVRLEFAAKSGSAAAPVTGRALHGHADRVESATVGAVSRTTLIKFLAGRSGNA